MRFMLIWMFLSAAVWQGCVDNCDDLPQAYSKEEAEYLPYQFHQEFYLQDSVGQRDTLRITYFTTTPVVEDIADCTISTTYIECEIQTAELDSNAAPLIIAFDVEQTSLIEVGNDMRLDNYIPSVNATYSYGNSIQILGQTFANYLALHCLDNSCGPVLDVIFAKEKGLVALRNQQGWKVLVE